MNFPTIVRGALALLILSGPFLSPTNAIAKGGGGGAAPAGGGGGGRASGTAGGTTPAMPANAPVTSASSPPGAPGDGTAAGYSNGNPMRGVKNSAYKGGRNAGLRGSRAGGFGGYGYGGAGYLGGALNTGSNAVGPNSESSDVAQDAAYVQKQDARRAKLTGAQTTKTYGKAHHK